LPRLNKEVDGNVALVSSPALAGSINEMSSCLARTPGEMRCKKEIARAIREHGQDAKDALSYILVQSANGQPHLADRRGMQMTSERRAANSTATSYQSWPCEWMRTRRSFQNHEICN
jgi:hypothetical protein